MKKSTEKSLTIGSWIVAGVLCIPPLFFLLGCSDDTELGTTLVSMDSDESESGSDESTDSGETEDSGETGETGGEESQLIPCDPTCDQFTEYCDQGDGTCLPKSDTPLPFTGEILCIHGKYSCIMEMAPGIWTNVYAGCDMDKWISANYVMAPDGWNNGCHQALLPSQYFEGDVLCFNEVSQNQIISTDCFVRLVDDFWVEIMPTCDIKPHEAPLWENYSNQYCDLDYEKEHGWIQYGCEPNTVSCFVDLPNEYSINAKPLCTTGAEVYISPEEWC